MKGKKLNRLEDTAGANGNNNHVEAEYVSDEDEAAEIEDEVVKKEIEQTEKVSESRAWITEWGEVSGDKKGHKLDLGCPGFRRPENLTLALFWHSPGWRTVKMTHFSTGIRTMLDKKKIKQISLGGTRYSSVIA